MRIMIDGMNLALEQGTGVATYSKNLSYCLRQKGHDVTALYGKPMRAYNDDLLREAMQTAVAAFMTDDEELADNLWFLLNSIGPIQGPFDAFLALRGLKTLHLLASPGFLNNSSWVEAGRRNDVRTTSG